MGKYVYVAMAAILFILVIIVLNNMFIKHDKVETLNEEWKAKVESGDIIMPKRVKVTIGDSLYHDPTCAWVGSDSKSMSLEKAIEQGFHPCEQCLSGNDW